MKRRHFLITLSSVAITLPFTTSSSAVQFISNPLDTNRLRPPGAVPEENFPAKCIRCGRCVEVCPYRSIRMLDIRSGIHAGTPLIEAEKVPCYLCMKCVDVCPTGSLKRVTQSETRMGLAIINTFECVTWSEKTLCRTCYDKCPFPQKAIRLEQLKPVIDASACTGCGLCTHACPITTAKGRKAINIEPLYARKKVTV